MKKLLFILSLFCFSTLWGQYQLTVREDIVKLGSPTVSEVNFLNEDAFFTSNNLNASPILPFLSLHRKPTGFSLLKESEGNRNYFTLFPVGDISASYFGDNFPSVSQNLGVGFGMEARFSSKFYGRILLTGDYYYSEGSIYPFHQIYRPEFWTENQDFGKILGITPQIRLSYTPYYFLNIQTGIDQNSVGQGNRSLLLGDYGSPYPFVQLRTKFWNLELMNLYQFFQEELPNKDVWKFASTHFFNYHVTPRLQIGVFESVVFAAKDTLMNRGYDVAYLNPFLFYRPTEYSLGSQDRLLLGLNLSYQFDKVMIYGQFALDDFLLKELIARSRWWANKYSGQLGLKGKATFANEKQFTWRAELNFARPFMYSHFDINTVYGNQGLPLAHPLGSNFAEIYADAQLKFQSTLAVKAILFFAQQGGYDGNYFVSYGKDVYNSYMNRPEEYGYHIGGNGKVNRFHFSVETSYSIYKKIGLQAFVRPGIELNTLYSPSYSANFLVLSGIRSNLWNDRSFGF